MFVSAAVFCNKNDQIVRVCGAVPSELFASNDAGQARMFAAVFLAGWKIEIHLH
jgi:hypothetical protein